MKTGTLKIQFGTFKEVKKGDNINKEFVGDEPYKIADVEDNQSYSFTVQKIQGEDIVNGGISMNQGSAEWTFSDGKKAFKIFIE